MRTWSRNGLYLRDLAAHLDPEQPVYSLAPPHFEEIGEYPETVGEWADFMLTRLAAISNEGCYRIGGYSFGGLVALEMAEHLAAQGAEIPLVLLLDTGLPLKRRKPRAERGRRAKRLARFGTALQQYAEIPSRRERRAYLWQQYSPTRRSSRREANRKRRRSEHQSRFLAGDGVIAGQIMKNASGVEISFLKRAIQVAYLKYTQQATELPLALIRTRKSSERKGNDASLGWSRLARGSFRSVLVEGGHFEMFDPPYLPAIAREIDRMLRDTAGLKGPQRANK